MIIFARFPELGKVKTRLAATTSNEFALEFYKKCLENLLTEMQKLPRDIVISIYCTEKVSEMKELYGDRFQYFLQCEGDLGVRMHHAFKQQLEHSNKAIIVGSDIPSLQVKHLQQAIDSLDICESVIGETFDGGYYLLGLKKADPTLFHSMPWSTDKVSSITKKRMSESSLKFSELEVLRDVDTEEDLKQL